MADDLLIVMNRTKGRNPLDSPSLGCHLQNTPYAVWCSFPTTQRVALLVQGPELDVREGCSGSNSGPLAFIVMWVKHSPGGWNTGITVTVIGRGRFLKKHSLSLSLTPANILICCPHINMHNDWGSVKHMSTVGLPTCRDINHSRRERASMVDLDSVGWIQQLLYRVFAP